MKQYKQPYSLHVACGANVKAGFINIDLNPKAQLRLDLENRLPFKDGTVGLIYSEHFFEHLVYRRAQYFLEDCRRILTPGGRLRIVVPDMKAAFSEYARGNAAYWSSINVAEKIGEKPEFVALIDNVNYGAYQFGEHKYSYDAEKLGLMLKKAGFVHIKESQFDRSIDSPSREHFSLYMDAEKA